MAETASTCTGVQSNDPHITKFQEMVSKWWEPHRLRIESLQDKKLAVDRAYKDSNSDMSEFDLEHASVLQGLCREIQFKLEELEERAIDTAGGISGDPGWSWSTNDPVSTKWEVKGHLKFIQSSVDHGSARPALSAFFEAITNYHHAASSVLSAAQEPMLNTCAVPLGTTLAYSRSPDDVSSAEKSIFKGIVCTMR